MKSTVCKIFSRMMAIAICGFALATTASAQVEDWDFNARKLEGSWKTQVTQRNCATGVALGAPFEGLLTFARGGTVIESTSAPTFYPAIRGNGHGVWSNTFRHHTFAAVFVAQITLNGVLSRTQTVRQTIVVDDKGDNFTASGPVNFVFADGSAPINGCATAVGQRIE
jgi:hypothetical protein